MPRRPYKRRPTKIDPLFENHEVAKLINYIMLDGKKTVARSIVYTIFNKLVEQNQEPLKVLHMAIQHVSPTYEVKSRRLGGASYLVPTEVRKNRKLFLALNWIVEGAKSRSNKEFHTFAEKLLAELLDASKNQGQAVNKKQQTEKLADANKAFAHLKW